MFMDFHRHSKVSRRYIPNYIVRRHILFVRNLLLKLKLTGGFSNVTA